MPFSDKGQKLSAVRRLCADAMLLGIALCLSYLEAVLPLRFWLPLPGLRLGLAQLAVTVAFFAVGKADAAVISFCRVWLMGILFGSATSLWFSACGACLAYGGLWLGSILLSRRMSYIGLGIFCAALHNCGQILAAAVFFGTGVIRSYLPVLLAFSPLFGGAGGMLLNALMRRLPQSVQKEEKADA